MKPRILIKLADLLEQEITVHLKCIAINRMTGEVLTSDHADYLWSVAEGESIKKHVAVVEFENQFVRFDIFDYTSLILECDLTVENQSFETVSKTLRLAGTSYRVEF